MVQESSVDGREVPRLNMVDIPVFDTKEGTKLVGEEEYKIQARKLFFSLNVGWM